MNRCVCVLVAYIYIYIYGGGDRVCVLGERDVLMGGAVIPIDGLNVRAYFS